MDPNENPYSSPSQGDSKVPPPDDRVSLILPASIALACCGLSLALLLLSLLVSLPYGNPNAPPLSAIVQYIGKFMILPALGLAGAVSMLQRKRYALSLAAACSLMVPVLGPCFGLTLPLGIWIVVLLRRPSIRQAFVSATARSN